METYEKLDPEFKAKWCAALRSGEYKQQTQGTLRSEEGYCCLAVAGVLLGFDVPLAGDRQALKQFPIIYDKMDNLFGNRSTKRTLWNMNDSEGKSFSEIADWIEANL